MKGTFHFEVNRNLIIPIIIMASGIFALLTITNLYSFRAKDCSAIVLDKALFQDKTSNTESGSFSVDKIVRFTIPYSVKAYDLLDLNTAALMFRQTQDDSSSLLQTGIYDLAKGSFKDRLLQEERSFEGTIQVSPDGKTMLTSFYGTGKEFGKLYVGDIVHKKNLDSLDNVLISKWLPDGQKFVGVDDYLFIYDIATGQRENLYKISDYNLNPNKYSLNLNILNSGDTICLTGNMSQGNSKVILFNLKTKRQKTYRVQGILSFYDSFPIGDNSIAYIGIEKGEYGLFTYDFSSNKLSQLINVPNDQQKFTEFCLSPDNRKIAYSVIGMNGVNQIHVASLNNKQVTDDEIVYQDSKVIQNMMWTKDSRVLYYLQNSADSAILGRILFKNL
ncbi:hypothetical protein [Desulfosporosinus sp. FKA]|uniref:TolB family protein n=1 Tax=Desulfosporosinus sp. FKA TaxID=1969834 RepID=UPI000B49EF39|nr:hypothetical protein [Desulfosporosinus sp. FKA]